MSESHTLGNVIATRLRVVRKQRGLTQKQLAERLVDLGLTSADQPMVARVEKPDGTKAENLPIHHLLMFAAALNVAPVHLMTPDAGAERIYLYRGDPHTPLHAGQLRAWIRGYWPLRDSDDLQEFFATIPREEFEGRLALRGERGEGEARPVYEMYMADSYETRFESAATPPTGAPDGEASET